MKFAAVIPVFNERESLPLVVGDLRDPRIAEIVVVDNGSSDDTAAIAASLPVRLVPEPRRGYGSACLAGIAALSTAPPDAVLFLDGDYSDHPEEAALLLDAIEAGADLAIGSRVLGRREPGALLPQARAGNAIATFLIRRLYGHRFTDLGPFRAIRWDALRRIGMEDTDFGWTCEMQVKAVRLGLRIVEVPVSYRRRVGVSKIAGTFTGTIRAGYKILWTVARYAATKPHPPSPSPSGEGER
ncbi:MAG TPA: glycosyltransferase family 2 protein [Thermoanaerobaculia bacterium]|nr:glycosyltransferase family 2 protein [Thermoanaerobaculia bacterium]